MVFLHHLAVGVAYLVVGGITCDAEDLVRFAVRHYSGYCRDRQ